MAGSKTKRAPAELDPQALEIELSRWRAQLSTDGAVKLSALKPKATRDAVVARLAGEGFEANKTWLRRPLAEQLSEALAHGASVARKSLAGLVRGATAAELQRAVTEAESRGELRRVLRGKAEALTAAATPVLTARELVAVRAVLSSLDKALAAAARKKGVTLLASDFDDALAELMRLRPEPPAAGGAPEPRSDATEALPPLLAALDATRDERTGLSFVPQLIARVLPAMPVAVAHGVLLDAARSELIELRPEGGLNRLTPEELRLCPSGPGGTRLSWARRLNGAQP